MNDLIGRIAQQLVDSPDDVAVSKIEGHRTTVFELRVAKEDIGKVIGREGRTAFTMRTLLKAVSSKSNKRALLEIIE
jgi:uncharacterized protein